MSLDADAGPKAERRLYLLICVMQPILYGAATRLPLVFIGVHAHARLQLSWLAVACVLGSFQLARAAANWAIQAHGAATGHVAGAAAGVVGYALIALGSRRHLWVSWLGVVGVGLSEVLACMQSYVKVHYEGAGQAALRRALRDQYASSVAGTAVGFATGGVLYVRGGVRGAAAFGALLEAAELLAAAAYLARFGGEAENGQVLHAEGSQGPAAAAAAKGGAAARRGPAGGAPAWINEFLAATFGVQAILVGVVLSTSPLFLLHTKGVDVGSTGFVFATGEVIGAACLFWQLPRAPDSALFREPFNMVALFAGMGAALLALAAPGVSSACAVVCVVGTLAMNDCTTSTIAECQAATLPARHYHQVNTQGNAARRLGNTAAAFAGPLLFQLRPGLPFAVVGAIGLVWAAAVAEAFDRRARQTARGLGAAGGGKCGDGLAALRTLAFEELECTFQELGNSESC